MTHGLCSDLKISLCPSDIRVNTWDSHHEQNLTWIFQNELQKNKKCCSVLFLPSTSMEKESMYFFNCKASSRSVLLPSWPKLPSGKLHTDSGSSQNFNNHLEICVLLGDTVVRHRCCLYTVPLKHVIIHSVRVKDESVLHRRHMGKWIKTSDGTCLKHALRRRSFQIRLLGFWEWASCRAHSEV